MAMLQRCSGACTVSAGMSWGFFIDKDKSRVEAVNGGQKQADRFGSSTTMSVKRAGEPIPASR